MMRSLFAALGMVLVANASLPIAAAQADQAALYYRITTKLEVRGRPFELDVVVRCGGLAVVRSAGGGRLAYGQLPYLYGRPTPEGNAVVMRVPDYCGLINPSGERAKAELQKLKDAPIGLPLVFWMDDPQDFDRLTAFTSLKGYDGEGSRLRYVESRFSEASERQWRDWRSTERAMFINRKSDPFVQWDEKGAVYPQTRMPMYCAGLRLVPIPDTVREQIKELRPSNSPLIWQPDLKTFYALRREASAAMRGEDRPFSREMFAAGVGKYGYDTIPYEATTVLAKTVPLAEGIRPESLITIHRIDLNVAVRGRAECRRGSPSYKNIWIVKDRDGGQNFSTVSPMILGDIAIVLPPSDTMVNVINGSNEDTYP